MLVLVRLRSLLARHPSVYWLAVALIVALIASTAWTATARLDAARRSWSDRRTVWVATADARAGSPLLVAARELPVAAIPPGAVDTEPLAAVATQHVGAGEVVTAADVGDGMIASLPPSWRAIAVSMDPARLPVRAGDHVSVYADGVVLAEDGLVLDVLEATVTVAVPSAEAAVVSVAARNQTAVLALRRP